MSNTENFFEQAENHSKIKLVVLSKFFPIWLRKVFYNPYNKDNNKLLVFDGFAGPGEYYDGEKGSPLICLNSAFQALEQRKKIKDKNDKDMEIFLYFCEKDKKNYDLLCEKIENRGFKLEAKKTYSKKFKIKNFQIGVSNSDFKECFKKFIEWRKINYFKEPCFAFIDPFGYKDVSLESVINLFNSGTITDVVFNMIYEHFNRFLTLDNEELNKTHKKFLGATDEEFKILQKQISNINSHERIEIITNFYMNKIKEKKLYVTKMEIKKGNKVKMILFYITKNLTGFNLFKEIKYKIETALEESQQQMQLFEAKRISLSNELENFLEKNYSPYFKFDEVLNDIKKHHVFFEEIYRQVIQNMRRNGKIETYKNGKKDYKAIKNTEIRFIERNRHEQNKNRMDSSNMESDNRLF
ncbi:three-Cys-motif partner protein TcmP [Fusobacterium mortiferum]|uniref:three-Cys-motif partner protein TcmP n=1 Tax=Fusobacterium mortiferum TaxID=850 RepID=UPI003569F3C5